MSAVDLHIHTTASDGRFSPQDIVRKAAAAGLAVISISDHDTVDGIALAREEAKAFPELRVIPGVEVSTDVPQGEVHILGYFVDYADAGFRERLEGMRGSRVIRAQRMVKKLEALGVHIDWHRVREIAGSGAIGRPHIAQAMLEKGYISSPREAFDRYIGRDGPAYVEREKLTPEETVELVLRSGGLPVLAHPLTLPEPEPMIVQLKKVGLVGIEAYYNNHTQEQTRSVVAFARKYDLITTGGSDYHGIDEIHETAMGGVYVPLECAERLIALARVKY